MNRLFLSAILILLFLQAFPQEREFQLWNQNNFDLLISNKTSVGISQKIHYLPKENERELFFADLTLDHKLTRWLEIGGGGRLLWFNKDFGRLTEKRPMLYASVFKGFGKYQLEYSTRLAYRFLGSANPNHFRNKQKLTLDFPEIQWANLTFFTALESFYKFNADKFHIARFYAGLTTFKNDWFDLKLYYVFQKNKNLSHWITTDILGLNMNIEF